MNKKTMQNAQRLFMTGISFITSNGPNGQNVMAAEWTMQISYKPMLIAVFIHEGSNTLKNIKKTKQFGVNVASEKQSTLVSIAGGYSRKEIDKLSIHNSFQVLNSKKTKIPLIADCLINAECKLFAIKKIGDHIMVVGRVISILYDETKNPLVYHRNRYFRIGSMIEPIRDRVTVSKNTFDSFHKQSKSKFILKCTGVLVRSKNKMLVINSMKQNFISTIPHIQPKKNQDYRRSLEKHLQNIKLNITLKEEPRLRRLILKNRDRIQRINFILFEGKLNNRSGVYFWKSVKTDVLLKSLIK
jgi:flavin reductase (DIM6/NTAB) family NADH-FMN oxidoreductase RutF